MSDLLITPYLHQKVTWESKRYTVGGGVSSWTSTRLPVRMESNYAYVTSIDGRKIMSTCKITTNEDMLPHFFLNTPVGQVNINDYDRIIIGGVSHYIAAKKTLPMMTGEVPSYDYFLCPV